MSRTLNQSPDKDKIAVGANYALLLALPPFPYCKDTCNTR